MCKELIMDEIFIDIMKDVITHQMLFSAISYEKWISN